MIPADDCRLAASADAMRVACLLRIANGHLADAIPGGLTPEVRRAVDELSSLIDAAELYLARVRRFVDGPA